MANAPINDIIKAFPEVILFECGKPDNITLRLYKDVSPERKKEIIGAMRKLGFFEVNIIVPVLTARFYSGKELTDSEKQTIVQALCNFTDVMRDCGIYVSEAKLGFYPPETKPLKRPIGG